MSNGQSYPGLISGSAIYQLGELNLSNPKSSFELEGNEAASQDCCEN